MYYDNTCILVHSWHACGLAVPPHKKSFFLSPPTIIYENTQKPTWTNICQSGKFSDTDLRPN